ncbi:permease prefix domain 1-containing protein [Microbacterium gorillae]|uniref:permease prefix domain 1-containing protein n=1 Tax=Microbacterium gorillae TaxID=1231063 RepID=UPI000694D952|nr:permease prefix domain 1-containing protein [Microbacterium gorillae]
MASLTERYVAAAVAHLPEADRDDVAAELHAAVREAVEARVELGASGPDAERQALVDLGDPAVIAADYGGRPLRLLGPRTYLPWRRTLVLLLSIVLPVAVAGVAIATLSAAAPGDPAAAAAEVVRRTVGFAIEFALHLVVWTTLAFVIIDRTGIRVPRTWSLDRLPAPGGRRAGWFSPTGAIVLTAVGLFLVGLELTVGSLWLGGHRIPLLHPDLYAWTVPAACVIAIAALVLTSVTWLRGASRGTAVAGLVVAIAIATTALVLLAAGKLVAPGLWHVLTPDGGDSATTAMIGSLVLGAVITGLAVWRARLGFVRARGR